MILPTHEYGEAFIPWREAARWRRLFVASAALNVVMAAVLWYIWLKYWNS